METILIILMLFLIVANYYWTIVPASIVLLGAFTDNLELGLCAGSIVFIVLFTIRCYSK